VEQVWSRVVRATALLGRPGAGCATLSAMQLQVPPVTLSASGCCHVGGLARSGPMTG